MNKRLVWNFEINVSKRSNIEQLLSQEQELIRWEARYFWPEDTIITLHGLSSSILNLAHFQIKERHDSYYLLPQRHLNIKKRDEKLLYKPLLNQKNHCYGFGKKINLMDISTEQALPSCPLMKAGDLLNLVQSHGEIIEVNKVALIYKFACSPTIKLELSRLIINKETYFSASIEGRSYYLVTQLCHLLMKQQISCDYITFLQQLTYDK
jgi:hypothetical protein